MTEIICKVKYLKFHSHFPGANELIPQTFYFQVPQLWPLKMEPMFTFPPVAPFTNMD